jgi:membrane protease YdiL (CAAX protease family)
MMEEKTEISPPGRWQQIKQQYRRTLSATIRSRAAWFFIAVLLAALAILALKGRFDAILNSLPFILFTFVFALLTIPLTVGVDQLLPIKTRCSRRQLWWQVVILLVVILLAGYRGIVSNMFNAPRIPLLYPLARWSINFLGGGPEPPGNWIAVPVLYFIIPVALLLLTGASWSELGLGRGYRSWRAALLWSILPLIAIVVFLIIGVISLVNTGINFLGNIFQNGFFEEFLFRGALMTRLRYLIRGDWGLVLSSLLFGLWHIGAQTGALHGDWLAGAASTIPQQAVLGLGMAIVFLRTRNLLASSIFHVLVDTLG